MYLVIGKNKKLNQGITIKKEKPGDSYQCKKVQPLKKNIFTQPENAHSVSEICPWKVWIFACLYIS